MISEAIYEGRPYVSKRIKSPCKDCSARKPACSSNCERYKEFKVNLEEAHKWLADYKNAEFYDRERLKYEKKLKWRKKTYGR